MSTPTFLRRTLSMEPVSTTWRQHLEPLVRLNEKLNQSTQRAADTVFEAPEFNANEGSADDLPSCISISMRPPEYGEIDAVPRTWTVYIMDVEAGFNLAGCIPPLARHSGALRVLIGKVYAVCTLAYMAWSVARFNLEQCSKGDAKELCQLTESMILGRVHLVQALSHVARGLLEEKMPWIALAARISYDMLGFRVHCIGEASNTSSFLHMRSLWPLAYDKLLRPNGF
jgi:hypothetical protein